MRNLKFHNKDGSLTRYALSCGYVEFVETEEIKLTLTELHNTLLVSCYNKRDQERTYNKGFIRMKDARKAYNELKRSIKQ